MLATRWQGLDMPSRQWSQSADDATPWFYASWPFCYCGGPNWSDAYTFWYFVGMYQYYFYSDMITGQIFRISWDHGTQSSPSTSHRFHTAIWNGTSFQTTTIAPTEPPRRLGWPMFYDSPSSTLYAAQGDGSWNVKPNNASWYDTIPMVIPPGVDTRRLVQDTNRRRIVLASLNDARPTIWEFDIAQNFWHERINMIPPAFTRRDNYTLGYHPLTGNVIIYGGRDANGTILGDVWHYDGTSFYQAIVGASPARRENAFMVYRSATQEMIMWGGSNGAQLRDTWAYTPGTATVAYNYYGAGCPGAAGTPYLDLTPNSLPFSGQRFSVMVKRVPFFAPTFMMVGASDTNHLGLALPYPLASLGMPGCSLLTGPDGVYTCTNVFGTALWDVQLPPGLGGQSFYNQAVIFDASANQMGVSLSNAGEAVVGF
jgi:hypothetical protein